MPERVGEIVPMETLPRGQRMQVDGQFQACWYRCAGQFVVGRTVLDAGAGTGYGQAILMAAGAARVESYDLVALAPWVRVSRIEDYPDLSFDYVLSMDVIEHTPDSSAFLGHLLRVAKVGVFFSTPNWLFSKAMNPHHYREFTPQELLSLLAAHHVAWKRSRYWLGNARYEMIPVVGALPLDTVECNFGVLLEKV